MAKTVVGLMDNIDDARNAVRALAQSGIDGSDIGFMANQKHALPSTAALNESEGSQAASGAVAGAALGGMAGFALALAPVAIPGLGALLAAGPLAAALAGAGVGAVTGGLIGGLTRLGVPEQQAQYYAEAVRRGGILVSVAADRETLAERAHAILKQHGAVDIDGRAAQWKKQGWKGRFAAQQFICKCCRALVNVQIFEQTRDGVYFARCTECGAKNAVVQTGATPSQPGILPVTGLID